MTLCYFFFKPAFNKSSNPASTSFSTFFLTTGLFDNACPAASSSCFFIASFFATLAANAAASDALRSRGLPAYIIFHDGIRKKGDDFYIR